MNGGGVHSPPQAADQSEAPDAATTSLDDRYKQKQTIFDRSYHKYSLSHEIYLAPIDGEEVERLEDQHDLLQLIFKDRENPLYSDLVQAVSSTLDCGYGTGLWAQEMAECYEEDECTVLGVDINPLMWSASQPDNLDLEVADLNERLTFPNAEFSFVHSRFVAAGIGRARWPSYLTDIKRILRPGGWVQLTEWDVQLRTMNGNRAPISDLGFWTYAYEEALSSPISSQVSYAHSFRQKQVNIAPELEQRLNAAGFTDVKVDIKDVPIGPWRQNAQDREIGEKTATMLERFIPSAGIYAFVSRGLGTREAYEEIANKAVAQLDRASSIASQPYIRLYTVCGRKP